MLTFYNAGTEPMTLESISADVAKLSGQKLPFTVPAEALKEGKSGVDYISIFDASNYPTRIAAEVKDWDVSQCGESPEAWAKRGRHAKFAAGAARQAIDQSGILEKVNEI